jgi:DNA/RNA-binding domain of Phe-tRNA-synthetase-like protein
MAGCVELDDAVRDQGMGSFGIAILRNVGRKAANAPVEQAKSRAVEEAKSRRDAILCRIESYENVFAAYGYPCPLPAQFRRTLEQGLPTVNRFVDTMFLCEMTTGVLLGAQDYGRMQGTLTVDLARDGEIYEGMRAPCRLKDREIVVRDTEGIVASYFQGSDKRTAITRGTSDVVFFGFGAENVARDDVECALQRAIDVLGPASESARLEMY